MLSTSYTPLITENSSFALILSKQLLHRMSLNTHVTRAQKSIEVWLHKWNVREIQPERSLWEFCVLRHPNHFLLAGIQHSSALKHYHYPTIPRSPCSSKLRFSVAYWQHILTASTLSFMYVQATTCRMLPRDFAFWGNYDVISWIWACATKKHFFNSDKRKWELK